MLNFSYQNVDRVFGLFSVFICPAVWGPGLNTDSLSHLRQLHNCSFPLTCGLRKYDHVSKHREQLGWLPVDSFVRYCSLCRDYYTSRSVPFNPAFEFSRTHCYETRCPLHHITTIRPRTACPLGGMLYLGIYFRTFVSSVAVFLLT